jgi:hypothetical protein
MQDAILCRQKLTLEPLKSLERLRRLCLLKKMRASIRVQTVNVGARGSRARETG